MKDGLQKGVLEARWHMHLSAQLGPVLRPHKSPSLFHFSNLIVGNFPVALFTETTRFLSSKPVVCPTDKGEF